jgi:hypothetical protein
MEVPIMAHFALLDENNIVQGVILVRNKDCLDSDGNESETVGLAFLAANGFSGRYVKTSYNTFGNLHYAPNTNQPDGGIAFRGNYAGKGMTYDPINDVFYEPQPFPSWTISATTNWLWEAPVTMPTFDFFTENCVWDENLRNWIVTAKPKIKKLIEE